MDDKLMFIPNDETQNYPFCRLKRLDTKLNKAINQNFIDVPIVFLSQRIRVGLYKTVKSSFSAWNIIINKNDYVQMRQNLKKKKQIIEI